ncbi:3-ketoacyl-CoA thiolase 5, peroxisomal-like isoform X2 [Chenopodium quinoa]|uniref:3-ketoacyl-CoA thiolase 5, peroxisomal-like isoform X2 n=2 Tax=Chenopodium quinoa TaxID=63459 RepID=UPI000B7741D4|nr:3-ketoacyl-CoA thiolase 5, peroxisomal-like isoform X2 [Chenopodium quinoa]
MAASINQLGFVIFAMILVSCSISAMGDSESAFIVAHKKTTLTNLSNGVERISVSIDLYNCGSLSFAAVGVDPSIMGFGPAFAIPAAVKSAGLKLNDINLFEINEYVYSCKKLNLDPAKVNVNGGAIALGHPLGATGAWCVATLLNEMKRRGRDCHFGVISMCIGKLRSSTGPSARD